jgi:hypothetical protein
MTTIVEHAMNYYVSNTEGGRFEKKYSHLHPPKLPSPHNEDKQGSNSIYWANVVEEHNFE